MVEPTLPQNELTHSLSRHAGHYASLLSLSREGPYLRGAGVPDGGKRQLQAIHAIRADRENILKALDLALEEQSAQWLSPLAEHLGVFLAMSGELRESREIITRMFQVAQAIGDTRLESHIRLDLCRMQIRLGEFDAARELLSHILDSTDPALLEFEAEAHNVLGEADYAQGLLDSGQQHNQRALELWRRQGNRHGQAGALNSVGLIAMSHGDFAAAGRFYAESRELYRQLGDHHGEAGPLGNSAIVAMATGDFAAARELFEVSLACRREVHDRRGEAMTLGNFGIIEAMQGNFDAAEENFLAAMELQQELGYLGPQARNLGNLGNLALNKGDYVAARGYLERALARHDAMGDRSWASAVLASLADLEALLGNAARARELFAESLESSRARGDRHGTAATLCSLGNLHAQQGEPAEAAARHRESLEIRREIDEKPGQLSSIAGIGALLIQRGQVEAGVQLLHGAAELAREMHYSFDNREQPRIEAAWRRAEEVAGPGVIDRGRAAAAGLALENLVQQALTAVSL